mgnify:CR=1 FL=1
MTSSDDKLVKMNASIVEITGIDCLNINCASTLLGDDSDSDDESHSFFGNDSAALAKNRRSSERRPQKKKPLVVADESSADSYAIDSTKVAKHRKSLHSTIHTYDVDDNSADLSFLTASFSSIEGYQSSPELSYVADITTGKLKQQDVILQTFVCDPALAPQEATQNEKQKQALAA